LYTASCEIFLSFLQVRHDLEHKEAQVAAAEAKAAAAANGSPKDEIDEDNAQTPEAAAMADGAADIDATMADGTSDNDVPEEGMIEPARGDTLYVFGSAADGVKHDFLQPLSTQLKYFPH